MTAGYLVAGALEVLGILLVVVDIRGDLARARDLADRRRGGFGSMPRGPRRFIYDAMDDETIRRDPGGHRAQMIMRQRRQEQERSLQRLAVRAGRGEQEMLEAITEILRGNLLRRLLGPACLILGVAIGTAVNVAAQ